MNSGLHIDFVTRWQIFQLSIHTLATHVHISAEKIETAPVMRLNSPQDNHVDGGIYVKLLPLVPCRSVSILRQEV